MKLEAARFPAKNKIAAFSDIKFEASNVAANKPKHVFRMIKGQKRTSANGKKEKPVLRNIMLKTEYLSRKQTKPLFWLKSSKIKVTLYRKKE